MSKLACFTAIALCLFVTMCVLESAEASKLMSEWKRQSSKQCCLPDSFKMTANIELKMRYEGRGSPYERTYKGYGVDLVYSKKEGKLFIQPIDNGRRQEAAVFSFQSGQVNVKLSGYRQCNYQDMATFRDTLLTDVFSSGICVPQILANYRGVNGTYAGKSVNLFNVYSSTLLIQNQPFMTSAVNMRALDFNPGCLPISIEAEYFDASSRAKQIVSASLTQVEVQEGDFSGKFSSAC